MSVTPLTVQSLCLNRTKMLVQGEILLYIMCCRLWNIWKRTVLTQKSHFKNWFWTCLIRSTDCRIWKTEKAFHKIHFFANEDHSFQKTPNILLLPIYVCGTIWIIFTERPAINTSDHTFPYSLPDVSHLHHLTLVFF